MAIQLSFITLNQCSGFTKTYQKVTTKPGVEETNILKEIMKMNQNHNQMLQCIEIIT